MIDVDCSFKDHSGIGMDSVLERGEATSRRLLQ